MTLSLFFFIFIGYAIGLSIGLARNGHRSGVHRSSEAPSKNPMRILIVGATGGTGRELVLNTMETHRVRRLVSETSMGIGDTVGRMGLLRLVLKPGAARRAGHALARRKRLWGIGMVVVATGKIHVDASTQ